MQLTEWMDNMEAIAPRALALDYDNPGLNIAPMHTDIRRVLVALDLTVPVAEEAAAWGADLVLTHHPLFFHGIKHLTYDDPDTAAAMLLVRGGIGHFSAHTNLDAAAGGVNDVLAGLIGLAGVEPFGEDGIGRVGNVDTIMPMTLADFAALCEERLHCTALATGEAATRISRVAVLGGAGGDELAAAKEAGADLFITGECKHHQALAAEVLGLCVLTCGHYETERPVLDMLVNRLQTKENDVQYRVALADRSPQRRIRR